MTRYCSLRFTHLSGLMAPFWKDISEYEGERTDESEQDDSQSRRSDRNGDSVSVCCI